MAPNDNLSAVLYGVNDIRLEQRPIPVPRDDQVLLQIDVVGICGSDIHYWVNGRNGPTIVKQPLIIGHEAAGTVLEVGKNVKTLKPGDRVAVEPGVPCRICSHCKTGNYHMCDDIFLCGRPPYDGTITRYHVHAADFCHKLPPNMSLDEGALMEPLSVGVHATKLGQVQIGDVVVILGAGPIGLVTLLSAKVKGASKIIVTDIVDLRLKTAEELGAHHTLKITQDMKEDDIVAKITELLGEQPNKTFECTGAEICTRVAFKVTKSKGIVALIGMGKTDQNIPLGTAIFREVEIRGVARYNNDYPTAIDMVSSGRIDIKPLITHHFRMEDTLEAFEAAKTQKGDPIKILIHTNSNWKPS